MPYSTLELFVLTVAVWQAVEIWHHGSIFQDQRAWLAAQPMRSPLFDFVVDLLLCPFCLSVWVAIFTVLLTAIPWGLGWWILLPLAISRLANLANDCGRWLCRTPNRTVAEED